jgi:UDP-N-acetylmuramoylalanine--D-glutamate ligase
MGQINILDNRLDNWRGKRVVVVGLARSGVGAANLLAGLGAQVTVNDKKSGQELGDWLDRLSPDVKILAGEHPPELFDEADLIVISPGVPLSITPLKKASEAGVKIIGELELAYRIVHSSSLIAHSNNKFIGHEPSAMSHQPSFLAVTGTNGKSTTTALLYEMVKNGGFNAVVGGNIGNALTEEIQKAMSHELSAISYIVAEVSSFQLETIDEFRPKVSAVLNITPDHLDRYGDMDEYIEAKCRIFLNQGAEDFLALNADDPATEEIIKRGSRKFAKGDMPEIFYFSRKTRVKGAYLEDGVIKFNLPGSPSDFTLQPSDFRIKGVHNIENAMAASLMSLLSGCGPDAVEKTLKIFPGLEHRLEFVREIDGVRYINDSKGTNVGAVIKSLESFDERVVLIAGGRDKDGDFSLLGPLFKSRVKALVLIGEAREKIKKAAGNAPVFMEGDLRSAVIRAKDAASKGDVVLLSPACASFDMFRDFEDRGRQFKRIVMEL